MKIVTVIGARPQFVKAAVVSRAMDHYDGATEVIVHTGQHYDRNMSCIFFEELAIPRPHHNLAIGGGGHGEMTGRMLMALEQVMLDEKPDCVLVYGDTNSTLAGALVAVKLHIPVAHVEAGLRSFNRQMPEEINRVLTDHTADLLFAPTEIAMANLRREGLPGERLKLVGDVMYDAVLFYRDHARAPEWFSGLGVEAGEYVLATLHRAGNTDDQARLRSILDGLGACGHTVILPLHPRTRARLAVSELSVPESIRLTEPVGYLEMLWLEKNCAAIVTDSGGVQKEAYFHGKRCVTVRDETEWVELVEIGANEIAGVDPHRIAAAIERAVSGLPATKQLYGDGDAGGKIAATLLSLRH